MSKRLHTATGVWCKQGLPLRSVLNGWVDVTNELVRKWRSSSNGHGDVPWWYNERANLSVFAGGVWRSGGRAFEEFSFKKRKIRKTTGHLHGSYHGRVDLYFETRHGEEFYLESKACDSGAQRPGHDPKPSIEGWLDEACLDVKKFKPYCSRRLGVVFVKPYIRSRGVDDLEKQMSDWLYQIDEIDCDAMAWVFPSSFKCGKSSGWRTHGVVAIIKEFKK